MEYFPIQTRVMTPPKDDLFAVLNESLTDLKDGDIVLITSKVVSIHHGRCISIEGTDKKTLIEKEADALRYVEYREHPLTVKHDALISAAGIDESNSNGYYTLLPENPYDDAKKIWDFLRNKHSIKNFGVIITDSHSLPFRYGAMSISIGFWGIEPVNHHKGKKDIFGREIKHAWTNIIDTLAAGSTAVAGECDEKTPIVIARGVPNLVFTEEDQRNKLIIPKGEDFYKGLLDGFDFTQN